MSPRAHRRRSSTTLPVDTHTPFRPGERLGGYVVRRVLAHDSQVVQLEAQGAQDVVVKLLWNDAEPSSRQLQDDLRRLVAMPYRRQVRVLDTGNLPDGRFFFVCERVPGWTLAETLACEGPLGIARTGRIIQQVLDAAEAARHQGVGCFGYTSDSVWVSRRDRRDHNDTVVVGELLRRRPFGYWAPEQAGDGRPRLGQAAADVYSVGCLAFELLAGRLPLLGDSPKQQSLLRRSESPDWPDRVARSTPSCVRDIIARQLAPDPAARPTALEAVALWSSLDLGAIARIEALSLLHTRSSRLAARTTYPRPERPGSSGPTRRPD